MRKFPKGTISQIAKEFDLSSNTISAVVNGRNTHAKQVEIMNRLTEITAKHLSEKKAKETELQELKAGYQAVASA